MLKTKQRLSPEKIMSEAKFNIYAILLTLGVLIVFTINFLALGKYVDSWRTAKSFNENQMKEIFAKKGFHIGFLGQCFDNSGTYRIACQELLSEKQLAEFRSSESLNNR